MNQQTWVLVQVWRELERVPLQVLPAFWQQLLVAPPSFPLWRVLEPFPLRQVLEQGLRRVRQQVWRVPFWEQEVEELVWPVLELAQEMQPFLPSWEALQLVFQVLQRNL